MRIGLFTDQYYPNVSGVVTSVKMLYEGLEKMGHECFIFTSYDEKDANKDDEELRNKNVINLVGVRYPFRSIRDYRFSLRYKKHIAEIAKYNLDIIHVHTEYSIAKIAIKASKRLGIPIVHTLHTSWKDYVNYLFPRLDKYIHRQLLWFLRKVFTEPISKASVFDIVPTKKILADLKLYGMYGDVKIVPTGIDLDRFNDKSNLKNERLQLKKRLGIDNKFIYGFIGRTSKEKNIEEILNAFSDSFKDNDEVRLLIVGGGPRLNDLKKQASELKIDKNVIFTGLISWNEIPIYYRAMDVFVNASKTETQGLTYIEALASGVPLLVRRDECLDDVMQDGYNGLYFDNTEDLIEKGMCLYNDSALLSKMKDNAYKSILKYSKDEYSKKVYSIYEEAISIYKHKK